MNNQNINFDRIEAFLFGQMPSAEAEAFQREMAGNADLAAEVSRQQLEHQAMELMLRQELKSNLAEWKAEKEAAASSTDSGKMSVSANNTRKLFFRIAAAASILLVVGFFARNLLFNRLDQGEVASNFMNKTSVGARYRGDGQVPADLAPVLDLMGKGDYRKALTAIGQVSNTTYREKLALLQGECYFRLKEYGNAATALQQLLQSSPSPANQEEAEWLLLLNYVAEGKHAVEAGKLFDRMIGDSEHPHSGDAKKLKGELK
jgi:tetratricopeptide (TPR) repeat protein